MALSPQFGSGHGHLGPLSPVELARQGLDDNPVWERNRPRRWGRARDGIYFGVIVAGWASCIVQLFVAAESDARSSAWLALTATGFVTLLACYLPFALIYAFDFLACRRWVLEDLHMTRLGVADIIYGSYQSGVSASKSALLPLLVGEVCLWTGAELRAGLLALVLVVPMQWLLMCLAARRTLEARSAFRRVDPIYLVVLPFACLLRIVVWSFIAFFALALCGSFLVLLLGESAAWFLVLLLPAYAGIIICWGQRLIDKGWRAAADNVYAMMYT